MPKDFAESRVPSSGGGSLAVSLTVKISKEYIVIDHIQLNHLLHTNRWIFPFVKKQSCAYFLINQQEIRL